MASAPSPPSAPPPPSRAWRPVFLNPSPSRPPWNHPPPPTLPALRHRTRPHLFPPPLHRCRRCQPPRLSPTTPPPPRPAAPTAPFPPSPIRPRPGPSRPPLHMGARPKFLGMTPRDPAITAPRTARTKLRPPPPFSSRIRPHTLRKAPFWTTLAKSLPRATRHRPQPPGGSFSLTCHPQSHRERTPSRSLPPSSQTSRNSSQATAKTVTRTAWPWRRPPSACLP